MDAARQPSRIGHFDHLRLEDPQILAAAQSVHDRGQWGSQNRRPGNRAMRHSQQPRRKAADIAGDAARAQQPQPRPQQSPRPEHQHLAPTAQQQGLQQQQQQQQQQQRAYVESRGQQAGDRTISEPRRDGYAQPSGPPAVPVQRDQELEQARQEIEKLRTIVRQQQQQIENAMAQVHDSVRKRENHKADLARIAQDNIEAERRMRDAHQRDVDSLQRDIQELKRQLEQHAAWQEEESEQHALELRECLHKQRELQKWKNQQLEARIANETDLVRAEEHFAARQEEHERVLASRSAEYARHREQWKADRERERKDHAQEVADLTKLHEALGSRNTMLEAELKELRLTKEQKEAEWEEERLRANVGLDELSSQHQVELARQNKQLNELKLQAEQRALEVEQERKETHQVQEGLQRKVNDLVQMLHDLTTSLEQEAAEGT